MNDSYAGEEPIEDDVECGLCGYGFDTESELKEHLWSEHYDVMRVGRVK